MKTGICYKKVGLSYKEKINIVNIIPNEKLICGNGQVLGGNYAVYYRCVVNGDILDRIHVTNENQILTEEEAEKRKKIFL